MPIISGGTSSSTASGAGVPGFDFADTYPAGTVYYETAFGGLYLKSTHQWDVSAAVSNPLTLPNLGITAWCRLGGDNNGWPVPGISVDNGGSIHSDSTPTKASFLSDLEAFAGSGNGLWWNYLGGADGAQVLVAQVGVSGAHQVRLASADGSFGPAPGGVFFPTTNPHIAGAWYDNAGTLTKSAG